jgi:hypothetical protein
MVLHFSEIFRIKNGTIEPRYKIESKNDLNIHYALRSYSENDLVSLTNVYFEVLFDKDTAFLTHIYLN